MRIPVAKPYLTEEEAQAAREVILGGWVTQGPKVEEFEERFAEYVGSHYAVAVSSCTTALHLSLIVAGIEPEDEVICPSLSFIATANAIVQAGAKPVFGEVDFDSLNLDAGKIENLITKKTKAIVLVHQLGMPADIDSFKAICTKYQLTLIEDAACAAGSIYKGKRIGVHSDLVCFSFHPRKVITTGDGGMITTNNREYFNRLKLLRQHGMSINDRERHMSSKPVFEEYLEIGFNYRMTDIQAAVGIEQLKKLDMLVQERRKIANLYNQAFGKLPGVIIPEEKEGCISNYQSYSLYLKQGLKRNRDEVIEFIYNRGISTRRGVMTIHREKAYKDKYNKLTLAISEDLSDNSIILPLFYPMSQIEVQYVIDKVSDIIR